MAELAQADVVLTTYSIVENEFRKNCLPDKVACEYCNKKFFPDRLKVHLRWVLQQLFAYMMTQCCNTRQGFSGVAKLGTPHQAQECGYRAAPLQQTNLPQPP